MTTKNTKRAEKSFDCLAYKDAAQAKLQAQLAGKSHEEQIALINRLAEEGPFGDWLRRMTSPTKRAA